MARIDPDSRVMQAVSLAADVVIINVLLIVCSLPLVTAGAATTAAHGALLEAVREEDSGKPVRSFFGHFRRTWRVGGLGGLLVIGLGLLLAWEYWALGRMDGGAAFLAQAAVVAGAILVTLWSVWFFPLATRGEGFVATAKLAALLGVGKLPRSVLGVAILAAPGVVLLANPGVWPVWLAGMAIIGFALVIYLVDLLVFGVLDQLPDPEG